MTKNRKLLLESFRMQMRFRQILWFIKLVYYYTCTITDSQLYIITGGSVSVTFPSSVTACRNSRPLTCLVGRYLAPSSPL